MTNKLFSLALSARGYDNYQPTYLSGEEYFITEILAPTNPKLCIDIGANIGDCSRRVREATNANVIAFELLPWVFDALKARLVEFSDRIAFENLGISDNEQFLNINYNNQATAHVSFSEEVKGVGYLRNENKLELPVTSLDSYLNDKEIDEINLIKIDTEGFESKVLNGAGRTIARFKPQFIQIEFNWHQLFRNKPLSWLSEKLPNYHVYQLVTNSWKRRDPKDPLSNIFIFSSFIFVRID